MKKIEIEIPDDCKVIVENGIPKVVKNEGRLMKDENTGEYSVYEVNGYDWSICKPVFYKNGKPVMEGDFEKNK